MSAQAQASEVRVDRLDLRGFVIGQALDQRRQVLVARADVIKAA